MADAPAEGPALPLVGCPNCNARNEAGRETCGNCGKRLSATTAPAASVHAYPGDDSASALRLFAWLGLLGGVIAALTIYTSFGVVEVPSEYGYGTTTRSNPIATWIAVGVAAQAVVSLAAFHALAAAAENTAAIRRTLDEMRGGGHRS